MPGGISNGFLFAVGALIAILVVFVVLKALGATIPW